ncbi:MAG: acetolactate synthase small subunit [Emcibacter sp.]|nr:acetolactate synthase small subunit [Emcibacter sp.]
MHHAHKEIEIVACHTLSIIVDNEAGVLAKVIGLFSGRGYNIENLTVAPVDIEGTESRITVVTKGTPHVIEQIKAQLDRLVPVHRVGDLTENGPHVERELALVKVHCENAQQQAALRIAEAFRAKIVDSSFDSYIFEVTGKSDKITAFVQLMQDAGLVEVVRTGVAALTRGSKAL